jgi:hypothetical protein
MHKKVKEAWTKAQDSSNNSNGSRRGKKHENQPPSPLLGFHPFEVCTGTWAIVLMLVAIFVTACPLSSI